MQATTDATLSFMATILPSRHEAIRLTSLLKMPVPAAPLDDHEPRPVMDNRFRPRSRRRRSDAQSRREPQNLSPGLLKNAETGGCMADMQNRNSLKNRQILRKSAVFPRFRPGRSPR